MSPAPRRSRLHACRQRRSGRAGEADRLGISLDRDDGGVRVPSGQPDRAARALRSPRPPPAARAADEILVDHSRRAVGCTPCFRGVPRIRGSVRLRTAQASRGTQRVETDSEPIGGNWADPSAGRLSSDSPDSGRKARSIRMMAPATSMLSAKLKMAKLKLIEST